MLVQRQHMQGEEVVAGMNVPRDQPHLTSARYTADCKSAFPSFSHLLKNRGASTLHHHSSLRSVKIYKLRDTNFTGASFPQSLVSSSASRSFRVPPSPQASVSAMMLSLQRRVESQQ